MKLKIMEWNIHQQGRQWNGQTNTSNDGDIPLWIVDQIADDINIVVFTEFNSHAKNIESIYQKLREKRFRYSTTSYSCDWSNDILIAIRGEGISVEAVSYVKAYPDLPHTNVNLDWATIPENLRIDVKINNKLIHLWGIRIKDLQSDYKKRRIEMETIMRWLKEVDGINILVGDFNNLRENTHEENWNLTVLDSLLGVNYKRMTPDNYSWGVAQSVSNKTFDGYIKNDHLIYSIGTGIKNVNIEPYKWDYLSNVNYSLKNEKYGNQLLDIPAGVPDHGILIAEIEI